MRRTDSPRLSSPDGELGCAGPRDRRPGRRHHRLRGALATGATTAMILAAAACGGDSGTEPPDPPPPPPAPTTVLEVIDGTGQSGVPGQILTRPVVLRVTDGSGVPRANVRLRAEPAAGAAVFPRNVRTSSDGQASFLWRLAPGEGGDRSLRVTRPIGGESVEVEASAIPFPPVDALELEGLVATDSLGALVDGRTAAGPADDYVFLGRGPTLPTGDFRDAGEAEEAAVFVPGRGMAFAPRPGWSDGSDTLRMPAPEPVALPLTIWIAQGPFESSEQAVLGALLTATRIFEREGLGVTFDPVTVVDGTEEAAGSLFLRFTCGQRDELESVVGRRADELNVYVVSTVDGSRSRGQACEIGGNFTALAEAAGPTLLSHEIGHNLSLVHPDFDTLNFSRSNVMHSASSTRTYLTEGQIFRSHLNRGSALNAVFGLRDGPELRNCFFGSTPDCPRTEVRLWPDGRFERFPALRSGAADPLLESCGLHDGRPGESRSRSPSSSTMTDLGSPASAGPPETLVQAVREGARATALQDRRYLHGLGARAPAWTRRLDAATLDPDAAARRAERALRETWHANAERLAGTRR